MRAYIVMGILLVCLISAERRSIGADEILIYPAEDIFGEDTTGAKNISGSFAVTSDTVFNFFSQHNIILKEYAFDVRRNRLLNVVNRTGDTVQLADLSQIYIGEYSGDSLDTIIDSLNNLREIGYAESNYITFNKMLVHPDDPYYQSGDQYFLHDTGLSGCGLTDVDIDAPEAWEIITGSPVKVGVFDDGVDLLHEDLAGKAFGDPPFDPEPIGGDHGTGIAGIIGAKTNNGIGVAGINWDALIYSKAILDGRPLNEIVDALYDGIDYGCFVFNYSFGSTDYPLLFRIGMVDAYRMNVSQVSAMGNSNDATVHYPAGFSYGNISVGGANDCLKRWKLPFGQGSSVGAHIDISAPASYTKSLRPLNRYYIFQMTSMAAAVTSGVASLLLSYDESLYNDEIEEILEITAEDLIDEEDTTVNSGWDIGTGAGLINAFSALQIMQKPYVFTRIIETSGVDYASEEDVVLLVGLPDLPFNWYPVIRHEVRKTVNFSHPFLNEPIVIGRGVVSKGYTPEDINYGMGYTEVIEGSITRFGCQIRTYVYHVSNGFEMLGWWPCEVNEVEFAYTTLGEYEVIEAPYITASNHYEHQSIKLTWEDPNPYEEGWIIERKDASFLVWEVIDTIPNNENPYFYYEDYDLMGGETYYYRVKPYTVNQLEAPYSNSVSVTARPNRPVSVTAYATDFSGPVPTVFGCDEGMMGMIGMGGFGMSSIGDPGDPGDPPGQEGCHTNLGNDITIKWSPDDNQKYPIVEYSILRALPPSMMGPTYDAGTDTCYYICPNGFNTTYNVHVYAISSTGDTSLPISTGVCTGGVNVCPGTPEKVAENETAIENFQTSLYQNYPNPFNPVTVIQFYLAKKSLVTLEVYDVLGRLITKLAEKEFAAGKHQIKWVGTDNSGNRVASGIYFYRIKTGSFIETRKMIILK